MYLLFSSAACGSNVTSLSIPCHGDFPTMVDQKLTLEPEIHTFISSKLCFLEYFISVTEKETETEI